MRTVGYAITAPLLTALVLAALLPAAALLLAAALLTSAGGCSPAPAPSHPAVDPKVSLLATGDTGRRHRPFAKLLEGQVAVGQEMAREDRQHPVDALVLLGDNFYWDGLRRAEMTERLRENLVFPYCHFLRLDGPRSAEVESACPLPPAQRHPVPLYALLGNHDLMSEESPSLQREAVAKFVPSWHMPAGTVEVVELGSGLSLVLFDSEAPRSQESQQRLVLALAGSRGPWRVIAAHTPVAIGEEGGGLYLHNEEFVRYLYDAVERAGVPIHLYLSGHHHSQQLLELPGENPPLHVIAGGGARFRPIREEHPARRYGASELGFARVDVTGSGDSERLVVSLFRAPTLPVLSKGAAELVARWSVDSQGRTRDELSP